MVKQEKAFEGSLKVSSCGRLSLVASITWLQNYKQGSVLQRFHFQSWRGLTQQQDSSPTGRDDSQDQQLVAAFSFCFLPGLPVTPVIQQNRQTTQATDQEKRKKKERRCGSVWQNLRGHKETLQFLSPGAETQDGTWDGREKREKREENRRTLTPHLQLNDSVAVATLARMLCKQPQIVSQDRTRIHARKVLLSAISPVKQLDFRLDFREKEISKKNSWRCSQCTIKVKIPMGSF